ncbi:glutathione S-transferase family protein [Roseospira marina]|uniref:Glutathione S-transferase family protein n=1 Tax=Roseospira marina TaxID=140057 RepID=A0A5M6ICX3_9PROT|nr:glutathione S-transferase family protein [Roseospira marina]KAA5606073.1 glutathione S-transferase family protein [Roseospira marina]MBB4313062.1 glutathione S-transferase [Roseospira marina]MBB5086197.1 glutathione S-transferase [Roseospira marina]
MRILYHHWLYPGARLARLVLGEKGLDVSLRPVTPWVRDEAFLALNPAGEVPVLVEPTGAVVAGATAVCEYLDEVHADPPLLGTDALARAEVRRLVCWFGEVFRRDVTEPLACEKLLNRVMGGGAPDSRALRAGRTNIHMHLEYIAWLTQSNRFLTGPRPTLADLMAGAHLSLVDYAGDVPWDDHPAAKEWYMLLKCRPCFRPLLTDHEPGLRPAPQYADLDF